MRFIFTMTPGRSGTMYLSELLKANLGDAEVHHERIEYHNWGVETPGVSVNTAFNSRGNIEPVERFWTEKWRDIKRTTGTYAETSRGLLKAGLCENLPVLMQTTHAAKVHLVILNRDIAKIVWSMHNQGSFMDLGSMWLWHLDPSYPRNIIDPTWFLGHQRLGMMIWYACEVYARAQYYKLLLADDPDIKIHEVGLESIAKPEGAAMFLRNIGEANMTKAKVIIPKETNAFPHLPPIDEKLVKMIDSLKFDPVKIAKEYFDSGKRLGDPDAD